MAESWAERLYLAAPAPLQSVLLSLYGLKLRSEPVEEQDRIAEARGCSREELLRLLEGDLDWIVTKAVARHRDERYQSAAELAEDIRRHLTNRPVAATPPSAFYLFSKLVRRHRGAVVAAALLLSSLVVGIAGTSLGFLQARREARHASAEAARANQEARSSFGVS